MAGSPSGQDGGDSRSPGLAAAAWLHRFHPGCSHLCFAVLTRPRKGTGALLVPRAEQPEQPRRGVMYSWGKGLMH